MTGNLTEESAVLAPREALGRPTPFPDLRRSPLLSALSVLPAGRQPAWGDHPDLACIRAELADLPALVDHRDISTLRRLLARVEAGDACLLHVGECAELFSMADPNHVEQRWSLYSRLADRLADRTGKEVVLVARMAGQHAKPRSQATETLPGRGEIPVYRGDAVNCLDGTAEARREDPWRLLTSYDRSRETLNHIQNDGPGRGRAFVSHEALLKDYEEPLTRGEAMYAGSGHLLWIGERTRAPRDWHVQWAATLANPIAVKLGAEAAARDVLDLVQILNPRRRPGLLSLIARMGAGPVAERLSTLTRVVADAAVPVLWQCDPMHGNTRRQGGMKLRLLPDLRAEITAFVRTLRKAGQYPGGLHLEVTPESVEECCERLPGTGFRSRPPCDPRLNSDQAMDIIDHFAHEICG